MCTAVTLETKDFYFGRNLDLHCSYNEEVCIAPRNYPFIFRNGSVCKNHYAIIGMAAVAGGYPLYYDATNEKGLSMAGLNFPENAVYYDKNGEKENIAPFEFIPYILGLCEGVDEAVKMIEEMNLWDIPFSKEIPLTPLHWIIADRSRAVTVEPLKDGLKIHENPIGVLTNNPPFDFHMHNLANYMSLTPCQPKNTFSKDTDLRPYSLGMGAIGLPGDLSSASRFVRAAFVKLNSVCAEAEDESVGQFFHIMGSVEQPKGLNRLNDGGYEYTLYSSCCNTDKGIYCYTTYGNRRVTAVDMHKTDLNGRELAIYPLIKEQRIFLQN